MNILQLLKAMTVAACIALISSCMLNSVRRLESGGVPSDGNAVIVYGIRVDSGSGAPLLSVSLDAYDPIENKVDGDCWHFNRANATVPRTPSSLKYFAFEVPPGYYWYASHAYLAPKNASVFIGDFVYTKSGKIEVNRNLNESKPKIFSTLPGTDQNLSLAESKQTGPVGLFLCTP